MPAFLGDSLRRFRRAVERQGLFPFLKRRISTAFNRLFRARLCVWVWTPSMPLCAASASVRVERYASAEQLPQHVLNQLVEGDSSSFRWRMREEFSEGGVLWVGFVQGAAAGYQWSRNGRSVQNWHFELGAQDVLIYSTVTFRDYRGRGVGPAIMARICREEVSPGGRACADCMVWNTPAVRFIQKTGFAKVAERKPLPEHPD